ncbi:DUF6894 family protein [Sphingomonas sp.]|jgi:hypothetical protein|uniref:DUF6894 family protein n=1 Tax=Sphingomonas sp. TaxID=28214 RepID=UPI002ED9D68F
MTQFLLRTCDRAGRILHDRSVEAGDVYAALAHAHRSLRKMVHGAGDGRVDPQGCIDVTDRNGCTVARLVCAEAIATMAKGQGWSRLRKDLPVMPMPAR